MYEKPTRTRFGSATEVLFGGFSSLLPRVALLLLLTLSVSLSTLQVLHHLTISRMFVFSLGRMGKGADG